MIWLTKGTDLKLNRLSAFTLGVVITAVSVGAVTFANAAGDVTLKACADKKTGVMRYIAKGKCKKTETLLSWNQLGPQGLPGAAGVKGDKGESGSDGKNSAVKISELSTCGDDGATLCAVGVKGPGGGLIFFVDYNNQYPDFNYLEAAPADAFFADGEDENVEPDITGNWATSLPNACISRSQCGIGSIFPLSQQSELEVLSRSIAAGMTTTQLIVSLHPGIPLNRYAAGVAESYVSPLFRGSTKTDWYLPSIGAMELIQTNLVEEGLGELQITSEGYWTSTPIGHVHLNVFRWSTYNDVKYEYQVDYVSYGAVRPIRAF